MRLPKSIFTAFASLALAWGCPRAETPNGDFAFTTREGVETTLYQTVATLQPDAQVWLLIFDPDCDECRLLEETLGSDPVINAGLADKTTAVVAIYPTDGIPSLDDPNLTSYHRACGQLPPLWTVGIDNGSIFDTDALIWDNLPLLLKFRANQLTGGCQTQVGTPETTHQ